MGKALLLVAAYCCNLTAVFYQERERKEEELSLRRIGRWTMTQTSGMKTLRTSAQDRAKKSSLKSLGRAQSQVYGVVFCGQ